MKMLLYGANGYTGELIARLASTYNLKPILAGRNEEAIRSLANELNLPYRMLGLDNPEELFDALAEVDLVLHAAGPFQKTALPMLEACIRSKTHYLDITGEIPAFELAYSFNGPAEQAGIMLMPGVGFDVVPTDCMALHLKKRLPDAEALQLAFASEGGGLSHGTAATMIMGLGEGGIIRENGELVKRPLGHKGQWVDFGDKRKFVMTIPWGDVATAYHTTGIANIETYTAIKPTIYRLLKLQIAFNWLLRTSFVRNVARKKLGKMPKGPSEKALRDSKSFIWGKVTAKNGQSVETSMTVANGYTLTAHSSLVIAKKIENGNFRAGYQTPAGMYGEKLILEVPGSKWNPAT